MKDSAGEGRVGVRRQVVEVGVCVLKFGLVAGMVVDMGVGVVWDWARAWA